MASSLTPEQVDRIATLARLALDPDERRRLAGELSRILEFAGQIATLDTRAAAAAGTGFLEVSPVEREDEPRPGLDREDALARAPQASAGLFTVPRLAPQRERHGRERGGPGTEGSRR